MRKLLWVGDAAVPSGFAKVTHEMCEVLRKTWDVTVLGMNYRGDPHSYPYEIFPCMPGGDPFGIGRLAWMCDYAKPDVVVIQQDPWNIPAYINRLKKNAKELLKIPMVGFIAVDGLNVQGHQLNDLKHVIFWTKFGEQECVKSGLEKDTSVVGLGVDNVLYSPRDKRAARQRLGIPRQFQDAFIVGNVNRNQQRKRLDLTIQYFANWVKYCDPHDAMLMLHVAPTGDASIECEQLAQYYGVNHQVIMHTPPVFYGVAEDKMADIYNAFDVQVSTTQGEGWGLTTAEGMACGVPQIVPNWSALGEWAKDGAKLIACTTRAVTIGGINVIGGIPDEDDFIGALNMMYRSPEYRESYRQRALDLVARPEFRWSTQGERFAAVMDTIVPAKELAHAG